MAKRFADHLSALMPAKGADEHAWVETIERIADLILRRTIWMIASKPHRFTEVEFYVSNASHDDPFTHRDEMQRQFARWYHHRTGNTYRSATFKGLDLTFGDEHTYAGMLIRGIETMDSPRTLLDGPCVCVDHLLSLVGHPSVASFVASYDGDVNEKPGSPSYLRLTEAHDRSLFRSARVGLSLVRGATRSRVKFIVAPYRFLTEPARIKKGRVQLLCSMHAQGERVETIARITGCPLRRVQRCIEQYELGRLRDPAQYGKVLSSDELCQMLGACASHASQRPALASTNFSLPSTACNPCGTSATVSPAMPTA